MLPMRRILSDFRETLKHRLQIGLGFCHFGADVPQE